MTTCKEWLETCGYNDPQTYEYLPEFQERTVCRMLGIPYDQFKEDQFNTLVEGEDAGVNFTTVSEVLKLATTMTDKSIEINDPRLYEVVKNVVRSINLPWNQYISPNILDPNKLAEELDSVQ